MCNFKISCCTVLVLFRPYNISTTAMLVGLTDLKVEHSNFAEQTKQYSRINSK